MSILDEIKNIFDSFWRPIIWWKNKNLIKNSGHKLKVEGEYDFKNAEILNSMPLEEPFVI